jgi:chemotaxis protein MotA
MNFSSFLGLLFGVVVMYFALQGASSDLSFFLDQHGILIVIGGTAASASISFPIIKVLALVKVFLLRVLGRNKTDYQGVISQLIELNKKASLGISALSQT